MICGPGLSNFLVKESWKCINMNKTLNISQEICKMSLKRPVGAVNEELIFNIRIYVVNSYDSH